MKENYEIIGAAHNIKEINIKKKTKLFTYFIISIFETSYPNKIGHLGVVKFNLFSKLAKTKLVPLGGINLNNLSKLKIVNCEAIAISSLIKDHTVIRQKNLK